MIYHGTPLTPKDCLLSICAGRAMCVSFWRPDDVDDVEQIASHIMFDNGAFSEWQDALRRGEEWFVRSDWTPFYSWLEPRLSQEGRWAVIPDAPGAPSQINDGLLNDWPFGQLGAPLWHMDASLDRLGRLCDLYDRVCLGWIGEFDPKIGQIKIDERRVGCEAYRRRMDEVSAFLGNRWPKLHMMRGVAVAFEYPFDSADSTSLAQNGHRYDAPMDVIFGDRWRGRRAYADRLERRHAG